MEHLYNPEHMPEQEVKDTFVAREGLVDRLVTVVRQQPDGAGVRHIVVVAPRGMGKTTVLLMVQYAIADRGLNSQWLAIRFPEELYGVTDLADFWLETLEGVARASGDSSLRPRIQNLKVRYPASDLLQGAALALLKDWSREHGRRLLLLVDNFNQILAQINDEQQNAALRSVLMNDGFLMILGAAPSFFKEASNYDQPLYNFFQIERLDKLSFEHMLELLRRRAAADGLLEFDKTLAANQTRLKVLEYFTGGNVRLILMLYRVVAQSALVEVREGLEKLLDQVTPFFKAKTEDLPPQQRKILDYIARTTGQTHEGVTPAEIAQSIRITPQIVSAQLKRLTDQGYVQPANLRGRSSFYVLSEPLYSLWYQMRFGRDARERIAWLVNFLKAWYGDEGLGAEVNRLQSEIKELLNGGHIEHARKLLAQARLMTNAMSDEYLYVRLLNKFGDANSPGDLTSSASMRLREDGPRLQETPLEAHRAVDQTHDWQELASSIVIRLAVAGFAEGVRELLRESLAGNRFFPLARALDYIETNDEALIEKLTPEMRPIVEEVVTKLRSKETAGTDTATARSRIRASPS
jgi:DNA-binding transcriptional ArsR family regulator